MDEQDILELVQEREAIRLPKRNNVKRKLDDRIIRNTFNEPLPKRACQIASLACLDCGGTDRLTIDTVTNEYVCHACGLVANMPVPTVGYSDCVYPRSAVSARLNYFKERMSQWCRREPPIPREVIVVLREVYGALRDPAGAVVISDVITKSEVRLIVIQAGLPPKKLVEKWLTIRLLLKGVDDCPYPPSRLVENLIDRFKLFLDAWNRHPELRGGRKSLPNINFLIHGFLLLESAQDYDYYSPWFPQVTPNKRVALRAIWDQYCMVLHWDRYTAEYGPDGVLRRIKQDTELPVIPLVRVGVRPKRSRDTDSDNRKWKERKITEFINHQ